MSTKEILNRLSANPITSKVLSAQLIVARRKNLDPVMLVGGQRVRLSAVGAGRRGTLVVNYDAVH